MAYYVFIYAVVTTAILSALLGAEGDAVDDFRASENRVRISMVGNAVNRYLMVVGGTPGSLADLEGTDGFESIGSFVTEDMGYAVANLVDVSMNRRFRRVIVYLKNNPDESDVAFLGGNDCGSGAFSTTSDWCKRDGSIYAVIDEREHQTWFANETVVRLDYLAQQMFNARVFGEGFPDDHVSGKMSNGELISLAEAVGYTGTPVGCNGVFNFDGAILTCEHLFGMDGTPIQYILEDSDNAILYVNLPFNDGVGSPHRVARPLRML